MESFELIDNFFQIVVLLCAAAAAGIFALRRRSRDLLILSLAYACFAMGTIYYVLYLVIIGIWPQVFYVAEISWLAAWLFYLSAQILRTEGMKCRFSLPAVMLQVLLYLISNYTHDYTRFQLYYAVDLALTLSMAALLPLTLREVKRA